MTINKQLFEDIKTIIAKYVDELEMDLLNPDQYEEEELECVKDDKKYALRILKQLIKLN